MYENRNYVIVPADQLHKIDFDQVMETSAETCRFSVDQSLTFVKYEGDAPSCLNDVVGSLGPYTHEQFLSILNGPEWTYPMELQE